MSIISEDVQIKRLSASSSTVCFRGSGAIIPKNSCGITGNAGMFSRRARGLKSAMEGYCSSPPMTPTGTIGVPVSIASRTNPRPKSVS